MMAVEADVNADNAEVSSGSPLASAELMAGIAVGVGVEGAALDADPPSSWRGSLRWLNAEEAELSASPLAPPESGVGFVVGVGAGVEVDWVSIPVA